MMFNTRMFISSTLNNGSYILSKDKKAALIMSTGGNLAYCICMNGIL